MLPFLLALALALALTLPALPYSFAVFNANCVEVRIEAGQNRTYALQVIRRRHTASSLYNYSFFRYEGKTGASVMQELSYSRNPPFKEYDYGFDREAAIAQFHEYVLKKTGNHWKSRQRTASRAIPCRSRPRSSSSRTTKATKIGFEFQQPDPRARPGRVLCCAVPQERRRM